MKPVSPVLPASPHHPEVIFAKDQPEYRQLPAVPITYADGQSSVIVSYELSESERAEFAKSGRLWVEIFTFGMPLQPQRLTVFEPLTAADVPDPADIPPSPSAPPANPATPRKALVCEHLLDRIEVPCVKILTDPISDLDSGISYLCEACDQLFQSHRLADVKCSGICESHCDAMTITRIEDGRTPPSIP